MSSEDQEQAQLIEGLQRGDAKSFRTLIDRYQASVFQVCLRMMRSEAEAEDMAQETFIRVSQSITQFRGDSSLSTWLYRVAINLCKNRIAYLKRRAQLKHDSLGQLEEQGGDVWQDKVKGGKLPDSPEELVEGREAEKLLVQALRDLPDSLREVLILRDIEGLSYAEIAEIVQLPLGTVKSRIHQARISLMESYNALQQGAR